MITNKYSDMSNLQVRRLIAERLGWKLLSYDSGTGGYEPDLYETSDGTLTFSWHPCEDMIDAWPLVILLRGNGYIFSMGEGTDCCYAMAVKGDSVALDPLMHVEANSFERAITELFLLVGDLENA